MPRTKLKDLMQMIYDVIQGKSKGPIYLHCWNGWHQSGYVSSAILRQFCKYSSEQAFDYWMENTDGVNKGYDNVKNQVKDFKPFDEFQISDEIKATVDYVVDFRQKETIIPKPSSIIKLGKGNLIQIIRE